MASKVGQGVMVSLTVLAVVTEGLAVVAQAPVVDQVVVVVPVGCGKIAE